MMLGEIRTWQPEGAPEGVRMLEIAQQPLRALHIPRTQLPEVTGLADLAGFGVLFLIEPAAAPGHRPRVFIGGTKDLTGQLTDYGERAPLAWETAVAIPIARPRVPRFHKELTKLVQFHCHRRAVQVSNHEVVGHAPACPSLVPAFLDRDLGASRAAIQTLLFALGHPVLGRQLRVVK
ncbi:hypothetical protein [Thiohalorhabdus sp.]|uniref:hypothetical protein n=1 Tax=Thiohalorhabdus sp. TaxID=3094134 RepID=UPI002FC2F50C